MATPLTGYQRLSGEIARLLSITAWILLLYIVYKYWGGMWWTTDLEFNFHPPMMTLGMLVLPIQAALIYRTSPIPNHDTNKYIHASFHTASIVVILWGVVAVLKSHIDKDIPNFYSVHSWIGLTTVLLFLINYIVGMTAFLYPRAQMHIRKALVPYHAFSGVVIVGAASATILLGLQEKLTFQIVYNNIGYDSTELYLINTVGLLVMLSLGTILYAMVSVHGHDKTRAVTSSYDDEETLLHSNRSVYA